MDLNFSGPAENERAEQSWRHKPSYMFVCQSPKRSTSKNLTYETVLYSYSYMPVHSSMRNRTVELSIVFACSFVGFSSKSLIIQYVPSLKVTVVISSKMLLKRYY